MRAESIKRDTNFICDASKLWISCGKKMTEKQLCDPPELSDLMNYVGAQALNEWESIALQLGLHRNEVKAMSKQFGEDSTEYLTEVFYRWKTHMTKLYTWKFLIDVLEQPAVDYRHLASTLRSKLASKLDQEPLLPELMNLVAPHVKDKWRVVGLELGIQTAELNGISAPNNTKFLNCYDQIFYQWRNRAKPEYPFTWSFLISVLGSEAVQRKDIANELEKKLAKTHQTDKATVITAAMVQPPNEKTTSGATSGCATHGNGQQQPQLEYDHSEKPAFGEKKLEELLSLEENDPEVKNDKHEFIERYRHEVKIVLQAANENERVAIFSKLEPPILSDGSKYDNILTFNRGFERKTCYGVFALGIFGGYKAVLVQTEQGAKCRPLMEATTELFPNVSFIIGVGVAYGGNKDKTKLGDVLVSDKIAELDTVKFKADGSIISRGSTEPVPDMLRAIFCRGNNKFRKFACTDGTPPRYSKANVGTIISGSFLVDNQRIKDSLFDNSIDAIGGEMEGYVLMDIIRQRESCPFKAIIIKGVCDYGDGKKEKQWQITAALAAVEYTHLRLMQTERSLFSKADGAAPGFQHPPPQIQPSGENPSDGRASHRSGQQQRMDQIDGVQSHEQLNNDYTTLQDKDHTEVFEFTKTACSEWKSIGRQLGFTQDALSAIVREPGQIGEEDYYAAMLRKWLDWAPPNHDTPTVQRLSVALHNAGRERLALCLEQKYRMHTS